jgi:DNA-binding MarR family transcriptional regulator
VDEREVHLGLTEEGRALRERVLPLRQQLLCEQGVEVDELAELRGRVGQLLDRFTALR